MNNDDLKRGVDFIGVTVPFVIHDGKKNFLLQKRSKNCRDEQGRWDVGGGSMEFGEEWNQVVIALKIRTYDSNLRGFNWV